MSTSLNAQTFVDLEAGLKVIYNQILHILHGSGDNSKIRLTTKEGALAVLDEIDQVTQTLREVIAHDTGESVKIKILHLLTGRNDRC